MPPMAASASVRSDSAAEQLSQATLKMYSDRPELDPRQDLAEFAQCRSTDDIMLALEKQINMLKDFRDDHWAKVCKKLKPVVQILPRVTNTAGESIESIGIPGGNGVFAAVGLLLAATQAQSVPRNYCPLLSRNLPQFKKRNPVGDNIVDAEKNVQNIYIISGKLAKNSEQSPEFENKFKEWLLGDQFCAADPATDRNAALNKRKEGTGDWLLQNSDFKNWRSFKRKSVLWLHGGSIMTAGTGKTILSAYVVNELLCSIPDLAYFFFRVKAKEDLEGMLSSTLLQLASGQERHKILQDAYNSDRCKGPPSRSSLLAYFKRMLTVPHHLVLIIDALDEHPKPRNDRDEPDICACLHNIGAVEVDLNRELNQKDDLRKYITGVLQSDEPFREWKHSHPDIIDLIKHRLLKDSIAPIDVQVTLKTLPRSLMKMYEHILQSIESSNPKTAQRVMHIFEVISCASRPLSVDEVAEVFAVQFNSDNSVQVLEEYRLKNPTRELVEKCTSAFSSYTPA
ncbi:hypothetical protein B0H14DRAFT_3710791 [Mycena olivaceomarginata]|nr:hypothetical protein B0H14DRAFT_3710791 [Mycena olivaceomarginata]